MRRGKYYGDGLLVAAGIAIVLALVGLLAVPSLRPAPGVSAAAH